MVKILNDEYYMTDNINEVDFYKVTDLLKNAFWSKSIGVDEVERGAKNSALVITVFSKDKNEIAYSRVISDKVRFAYILDVYVHEAFRKRGIGQEMIRIILNHQDLKDVYQWMLITKDAHEVYVKAGFKKLSRPEDWMEIRNDRSAR